MRTINDIHAEAVVFRFGSRELILTDGLDTLAFWDRFGQEARQTTHCFNLDDYGDHFFAFWVEDCFAPPIAIIRATLFEDAYEIFCDEFSRWMAIDETDLHDYDRETLNYSASGVAIDTESVQGEEIELLRIIVKQ